jgi:hypothetical protein
MSRAVLADPTMATVFKYHVTWTIEAYRTHRDGFPVRIIPQLKDALGILDQLAVTHIAVNE